MCDSSLSLHVFDIYLKLVKANVRYYTSKMRDFAILLRFNKTFGTKSKNFVLGMVDLFAEHKNIFVVTDISSYTISS